MSMIDACCHIANNCKAQIFIAENKKQLDKLFEVSSTTLNIYVCIHGHFFVIVLFQVKDKMAHVLKIIQYSSEEPIATEYREQGVINWEEFLNLGSVRITMHIEFFNSYLLSQKFSPSKFCTYIANLWCLV